MAGKPKLKDCDRVLIVEGYSDLLFYAEFLQSLGKHSSVYIKEFGGKADLLIKLEDFITPQLLTEKVKIGVIVDGNGNPAGTFTSIQNKLTELTAQTVSAAGVWTGGKPDIGVFIAADAATGGEIETLVWRAWSADPANAATRTCIVQYRDCMAAAGFAAHSPEKGLISSLLAIRNDDDPRLGPGARAGIFDFNAAEFTELRTFLSGL